MTCAWCSCLDRAASMLQLRWAAVLLPRNICWMGKSHFYYTVTFIINFQLATFCCLQHKHARTRACAHACASVHRTLFGRLQSWCAFLWVVC